MRLLVLLIVLLIPSWARSQCKGIKTKEDRLRGATIWHSSYRLPVGVLRVKWRETDSLFVICNINNQFPAANTTGVYIAFSDSTYYRDEGQKARLMFLNDHFYHVGYIHMGNDSLRNLFLHKEVATIGIGVHNRNVTRFEAAALKRYLECLLQQ